jgi:hypothetical protein
VKLRIEPGTTVGALLQAYPEAEEVLMGLAPAFARLRNPLAKRTFAKVATLEQAAKIGGVNLRTLIERLRALAGQTGADVPFAPPGDNLRRAPEWVAQGRIVKEIDAAAMLERGLHPLGKIREAVKTLGPGELLLLRAPFRPQPLIDIMRRAGAPVHYAADRRSYVVYFGRLPGSAHPFRTSESIRSTKR